MELIVKLFFVLPGATMRWLGSGLNYGFNSNHYAKKSLSEFIEDQDSRKFHFFLSSCLYIAIVFLCFTIHSRESFKEKSHTDQKSSQRYLRAGSKLIPVNPAGQP